MVIRVYKNNDYLNKFKEKDQDIIKSFFTKLERNIDINKKDKRRILLDFVNYVLYYKDKEDLSKILDRIDNYKYLKSKDWYPLDNSSKIYPLSMQEDWMSIYRLSIYLKEMGGL